MHPWYVTCALCTALGLAAGVIASAEESRPTAPPVERMTATAAGIRPGARDPASATMRFLEDRVRRDPDDASASARLAVVYLQKVRETGSLDFMDLARRAANASLASVPAIRNSNGLAALAHAEFASHEFVAARDHARELAKLDPAQGYVYGLLGDTLLELGDYDAAGNAYDKMDQVEGHLTVGSETRHARFALLHGDISNAQRRFSNALALARSLLVPPRETIAWCQWQLADAAFAAGNYETAERYNREALATFPDYVYALASLGRVRAARGDLWGAIEHYRRAVTRLPDPTFVAALGDLYKLAGNEEFARAQYLLVEQIGHLSAASGVLYNRQLALFHADHDLKPDAAYADAVKEFAVRQDIFGADAVAWTALKANKINEAQAAINEALRFGTQDARLLYHAGMIARAAGDEVTARGYIERVLALNPQFDPLQASLLKASLGE